MTHTGEMPFETEVKQEPVSAGDDLVESGKQTVPSGGERGFRCGICGVIFNKNSNLKRHMLTHTGEKPYRCAVCDCRFSQNTTLQKHVRTHTGEKPFECDLCQTRFAYKSTLKKHMFSHINV